MPKIKKPLENQIIDTYLEGIDDLRKLSKKYKKTSSEILEILQNNGIL